MKNIYDILLQNSNLNNIIPDLNYGEFVKKDKSYEAKIVLAGTPKSDIEAWIDGDVFHVKTKETAYQAHLPDSFDKDSVKIKYQDGIFSVIFDEKKKNVKKISF